MLLYRLATATSPDELTTFSRSVAGANIPVVSSIAQKDVIATEESWQAYHGVDLDGNALSNDQRSWLAQDALGKAFEGTMETVALGMAAYAVAETMANTVQYYRSASSTGPTGANSSNQGLNFTDTTAKHMNNPGRYVPVQTLQDAIKSAPYPDPQGSSASMYYNQMYKNGSSYNLEVLYESETNTIFHFQYGRDRMGPLPAILKTTKPPIP